MTRPAIPQISGLSRAQSGVYALSPEQITPKGIGAYLAPSASAAFRAAAPEVKRAVGRIGWVALYPAWMALTSSTVLRVLLRVGIELALLIFAPALLPFVRVVLDFIKAALKPAPVGGTASAPDALDNMLDFVRALQEYREHPKAREYVAAAENMLMNAVDRKASAPALIGASEGEPGEIE